MRVLAGKAKGTVLTVPRGKRTRPTQSRARRSLMDTLTPRLPGARFLDLFAGSGSVGMEAISRGASLVVFVEQSRVAASAIAENLARAGLAEQSCVLNLPVVRAICELEKAEPFDFIFCDPPYATGQMEETLRTLSEKPSLLTDHGWLILQHHWRSPPEGIPPPFVPVAARRVGDTVFGIYERLEKTPRAGEEESFANSSLSRKL